MLLHKQLYVGCSRVGKPSNLFVLAPYRKTKNVVYLQAKVNLRDLVGSTEAVHPVWRAPDTLRRSSVLADSTDIALDRQFVGLKIMEQRCLEDTVAWILVDSVHHDFCTFLRLGLGCKLRINEITSAVVTRDSGVVAASVLRHLCEETGAVSVARVARWKAGEIQKVDQSGMNVEESNKTILIDLQVLPHFRILVQEPPRQVEVHGTLDETFAAVGVEGSKPSQVLSVERGVVET
ncbi:hypothetical protein LAZ67_5002984 [Cordylochernes scorpioides]|uniref:Uncharacterized protein n=1 Tax=Cordylochernes scorpioides TaxID=51811 RepID=A0ABY6KI24_9ARAC|nr:hypothetical protein LAZ67_5002984 [Cordylochernes scorpioides]